MTRSLTLAVIQSAFNGDADANHAKVEAFARSAAKEGARLVLAPELFSGPYFCKTQDENKLRPRASLGRASGRDLLPSNLRRTEDYNAHLDL